MVPSMNCNWLACHLLYIHNITYNTRGEPECPHSAYAQCCYGASVDREAHGDRMPAFGAGKFGRTIHSGGHRQEPSTAPPARAMARSEDAKRPEASEAS
jgi:hypothetical protein